MGVKAVYVLKDDNGKPCVEFYGTQYMHDKRVYNTLLLAFGLGPFSFEEGLGALMVSGFRPRELAKSVLNAAVQDKLVVISE